MKKILFSLTVTSTVSALFALLFAKFIIGFAIIFVSQIILFYIGNTIYSNYVITRIEEIKLQQLKEVQKQQTILSCPCANENKQAVDMNIGEEVTYKCNKCDKNIKAILEVKNYITTQPIYFDDRSPKNNDGSQADEPIR